MKMSFLEFFNSNHSLAHFFHFNTTFSTRDIVQGKYYVLVLQLKYVEGLIKGPKHAVNTGSDSKGLLWSLRISKQGHGLYYIRKIALFDVRKTKCIQ